MEKIKKASAIALAAVIFWGVFRPLLSAAETGRIAISSANDFVRFSKNCTLDSFSEGKTVVLMCDVDLDGVRFSPVPIFSGSFDGQGHTIKGLTIKNAGSVQGLFRCVMQGGEVKNLTVEGSAAPSGTKNTVGGICGRNRGIIQNCRFVGTVEGKSFVGGICGINEKSGEIRSCTFSGAADGEECVGGICGKNFGLIVGCSNEADVNTKLLEDGTSVSDLDIYSDINNLSMAKRDTSDANASGAVRYTDVGGIAGYSGGIIQSCENSGEIGYAHVGYNVGGIAGRQAGMISSCTNKGNVFGRKDAGGICGQAEPYIFLNSSDGLDNIENELDALRALVNTALDGTDNAAGRMKNSLEKIGDYAKDAKDDAKALGDEATDFIDENIEVIDDFSVTVSDYIDRLEPLTEDLTDACDALDEALGEAKDAVDAIDLDPPALDGVSDEIEEALNLISGASADAKGGINKLKKAMSRLEDAVTVKNKAEQRAALNEISAAVSAIERAQLDKKDAAERIKAALKALDLNAAAEAVGDIIACEGDVILSLRSLYEGIVTLAKNTSLDFDTLKDAADYIDSTLTKLSASLAELGSAMGILSNAMDEAQEILSDFADEADSQLDEAGDSLSAALDKMRYASEKMSDISKRASDIFGDLSDEEPVEFVTLGDSFRETGDSLFETLELIGSEMDNFGDILSEEEHHLTSDIRKISDKMSGVMDLIQSELRAMGEDKDADDYFRDLSEENAALIKEGKIARCTNYAAVEADYNTGGIIGAMAIEYSLDPEDDIEKPSSFNFVYETKAIAYMCVNYGAVKSKKDCAGGICGKMDLGSAIKSENYADAESSDGNYVGGIAGRSSSFVIGCFSKAAFKGKSFVGGICGYASKMRNSYSIARIDADEYLGAVAGFAEDEGKNIEGNFYVDNGFGAIDLTSYTGKAEPIEYDVLKELDVPEEFISFSVTFKADGKVVAVKKLRYKEPLKHIVQPEVPLKDGFYGTWTDYPEDTVTSSHIIEAEYSEWITIIESDKKSASNVALAFAEGLFTDRARLSVKEAPSVKPPEKAGGKSVAVYEIELQNTSLSADAKVPMRFLNENRGKAEVWQMSDGFWQSVPVKDNGRYLKFTLTGTETTICVSFTPSWLPKAILIICLLISALIITVIVIIIKKEKIK